MKSTSRAAISTGRAPPRLPTPLTPDPKLVWVGQTYGAEDSLTYVGSYRRGKDGRYRVNLNISLKRHATEASITAATETGFASCAEAKRFIESFEPIMQKMIKQVIETENTLRFALGNNRRIG